MGCHFLLQDNQAQKAKTILSRIFSNLYVYFLSKTEEILQPYTLTIVAIAAAVAAAKSLQSCLTLCNLIDSITPGSPVPGILQARALEWVAISFSNA